MTGGIGFILLQLCYKLRRDVTRRLRCSFEENLQKKRLGDGFGTNDPFGNHCRD